MRDWAYIIEWDWKAQPPWDEVQEALRGTFSDGPHFYEVDTESDSYAVVVANRTATKEEAQKWYDDHKNDE